MVAQLDQYCDHGLHRRLRVRSALVAGGVNILVNTVKQSHYMNAHRVNSAFLHCGADLLGQATQD